MPSDPIVNTHFAKTHLSRLLERIRQGERIIIANAGDPVAVLSPLEGPDQTATASGPVVRETVPSYRAGLAPGAPLPAGVALTARTLAERWETLPHLGPDEAAALAEDIVTARQALPPVVPPWE